MFCNVSDVHSCWKSTEITSHYSAIDFQYFYTLWLGYMACISYGLFDMVVGNVYGHLKWLINDFG
ncbi:Protein tweety [Gossypium arboreum]|uniref:Protein tweety n=1 Tax=Gossypium arboreum TaxID=29729 RepID=A0A0B0NFZ7_GOSAR|nr:Protein tweety [Gossypium arboreum]